MKPITILRHIDYEDAGYLATFLQRRNFPFAEVAIDCGAPLPPDANSMSALVLMGGPMSVNDALPWIEPELKLIRDAHRRNIPVLGHCLGGQLIAKALGASVGPNPVKEIGWFDVKCAPQSTAPRWLQDLPTQFLGFHWHGETFELPAGAAPLFSSESCKNQGFAIGNTLALQFHVEITTSMIATWATRNVEELNQPAPKIQTERAMLWEAATRANSLNQIADVLYGTWIAPALIK